MLSIREVGCSTLYLLVSFPLGIAYFAFVVAGVATGVALLLFVVGVVVFGGVTAVSRRIAVADAVLGQRLFGIPAPTVAEPREANGLVDATIAELTTLSSYRSVAYLLVRFAVGVGGFTFVVTWLAISGALLATPLYYDDPTVSVEVFGLGTVETMNAALAVAGLGVVVAVLGALVVAPAGRVTARGASYLLDMPRPDLERLEVGEADS